MPFNITPGSSPHGKGETPPQRKPQGVEFVIASSVSCCVRAEAPGTDHSDVVWEGEGGSEKEECWYERCWIAVRGMGGCQVEYEGFC